MPHRANESNDRIEIRVAPEIKARIARAAAMEYMDLTQFVTGTVLREAEAVIKREESTRDSERDFARIPELLEHPPAPNAKLKSAIDALPDSL